MVIWCIGLSGSGKTTLGREIAKHWRALEPNTVLLDGDELREVFGAAKAEESYTVAGRRRNAERITALCQLLDRQGINVVCCILSIFQDMRNQNRTRFSKYFEVFMDAPMRVLEQRDVKGLYAAAREGKMRNVVGVDIPFDRPANPNMIVDSSSPVADIQALAKEVLDRAR